MLQILHKLQPHKLCSKQVRSFLAETQRFFATSLVSSESPLPSHASRTNETGRDLSSFDSTTIAKSVIPKCTHLLDSNRIDESETFRNLSPYIYYLTLSGIYPEIIRRFWRVSVLKPQDVLEILLGFDCDGGDLDIELKKIRALWGLFRWASKGIGNFEHLPQSCRIMAKMLVRVDLFEEAECLLSRLDGRGILMGYHEIFSDLIVKYKNECDFQGAILKYNQMRRLGLTPSFSCCLLLLELLVQMNEVCSAHEMYLDMFKMGMEKSLAENKIHESVVRLLCMHGKVQDARNLVKSLLNFGIQPGNLVVDAIVSGYCNKRDYEDIPGLFLEVGVSPNVVVGNKVIFSLSREFGAERADLFMQELEQLGFCPDEITYGILIGQSCREGRLRSGFIYLSEVLSRNLRPSIYSYNALMSGLFKEGMWKQSRDVLQEMDDSGLIPNLSTFKVLLAGFFKARQFGEVNKIVTRMAGCGLIQSSLLEDQLSIALTLLGLCPLTVKVRRDNDIKSSRTEFFDELGNGLYLDTDLDKFDKRIDKVFDDVMFPDFNFYILENLANNDIKVALGMMDEMEQWGQELSLSTLSTLLHGFSTSRLSIKTMNRLLEKTSKSLDQLDQRTLNLLIQKYSKRGLTCRAKMIFDMVRKMQMEIEKGTYTALLISLCKKGNLKNLHDSWKLARESNWSPESKDVKAFLDSFCNPELLNVALELLEIILLKTSYRPLDAIHFFIEKLCSRGLTSAANALVDELAKLGLILDEMTCSFLISGFLKEKRITEAFTMFDVMVEKNIVPPLDASLQLITQLDKIGNIEKAFAIQEIYSRVQYSDLQLVSCALINVCCKRGRIGEASNLFHESLKKDKLQNAISYNSLLQGYYQVNNVKKGGELVGSMIRKNLGISISSYRKLMQKTSALGKLSDALGLKELMLRESSSVPEIVVYNILIFYLSVSARNNTFMDSVMKEIEKKGLQLDRVTYDFIIRGASFPQSLQYLGAMISHGFRPSNRSLRAVIGCLCSQGEVEKALALGEEMESRNWIQGSVIQSYLFEALVKQNKLPKAVEYLNRLIAKGLTSKSISYDYQIKLLCQNGEPEKASNFLNIMLKKGGNAPDSASFDYLIQGFFGRHEYDLALDLHAEMLQRNLNPSIGTWRTLVIGLSEVGKVTEAERFLHLMVKMGETPSKEMYTCVMRKYRSLNNLKKAAELMQAMQESGGYEPDFETHWSLITNINRLNHKEEDSNKNRKFLSRLVSGIGFPKG